jgi:uncharacterized caspase-like protein
MSSFLRHAFRIVCAVAVGFVMTGHAMALRRVALVVGNAKYEYADRLANTVNDATAVAALLNNAGFDIVDLRRDVGVVEFKRALREFLAAASDADITVVYYSGHGFEIGGVNYLIPVDAQLASDYDVEDETIALDRVIEATRPAKQLSLIILDACRDNPFLRAPAPAMAKRAIANRLIGVVPTGADTLIAYAAKAGSVSFDGGGANSPFTTALVKYIAQPGLDIRIAFGKVRDDVLANTGGQQEPFVYGSLGGGVISLVPAPAELPTASPQAAGDSMAADYAMAERVGSPQAWQAFLAAHNSGYYASLARAQLTKLSPSGGVTPAARAQSGGPVGGDAAPGTGQSAVGRADGRQASLKTGGPSGASSASVDPNCKAQAARLARLRLDPDEGRLAAFARELTCEDLRPQVKRFMESLGVESLEGTRGGALDAAATAQTLDMPSACKRDAAELARVRASPDRESALRFARELKCEDLRPQAARLLDSMGD